MSTFEPLKQCDTKWANNPLGSDNICKIGCTITCCAMARGITPDIVAKEASFNPDGAILWESLSKVGLTFVWRNYTYNSSDNAKVLQAIKDNGFCLVQVLHPSGIYHWVLFIGDKKMIDPLTGKVESTSKYKTLTGYCILKLDPDYLLTPVENAIYTETQMTVVRLERDKNWTLYQDELAKSKSLLEETQRLDSALKDTKNQLNGEKIKAKEYQDQYNKFVDKVAEKIGSPADEANIMKKLEMDVNEADLNAKAVVKLQDAMQSLEQAKKEEIEALKKAIDQQNIELDKMKKQNDTLTQRLVALEADQTTVETSNKIIEFIKNILKW